MALTTLSTILDRMNRYSSIARIEEQYKVRDLDEAIRGQRREILFPWNIKKSTLRVFPGVLEYPVASDHDELVLLDNDNETFARRARFRFTSIAQFYEDPDYRNDMADIWDGGTKYLGVRYQPLDRVATQISTAEDASLFTGSGDAGTPVDETVVYKEGSGSVKIPITSSSGTATVVNTFTAFADANYKRKYYFRWVYLDAAPTSITLQLRTDASNYLSKTVTTQFSGQAFKADDWNLLAFDLNDATTTGTFNSASIASEVIIFTGAATGTYYLDASYLREWELLDYWYYSKYTVALTGATVANQEYFFNSSGIYSTDSQLVADTEWIDVVQFDAMLCSLTDEENKAVYDDIKTKRDRAWASLKEKYPEQTPMIITNRYRFNNNPGVRQDRSIVTTQ